MSPVLNYTSPGLRYNEIFFPDDQSAVSVISELDIELLKSGINNIDERILYEIIDKIFKLGNLEDNWDSYGGVSVSDIAIVGAHSFIAKVVDDESLTTKRPSISPEPNGGILLKWKKVNKEFLIWFMPNSNQFVYVEVLLGNRVGGKVDSLDKLFKIFKEWCNE